MSGKNSFQGFPRESICFFEELAANNNKRWFENHRSDYEQYVLAPAREFISVMGERLKKFSPRLIADPHIDRSIFRIHRDSRFSRDKSPYKTHLGIWLWEGSGKKLECSGYYFHLQPPTLMLGVGIYIFSQSLLKAYRDAVVHDKHGPALIKAVQAVQKNGNYLVGERHFKRTPRGYDPNHKYAEFLLHNGLHVYEETPIPKAIHFPRFMRYCEKRWKDMSPVHKWLLAMTERMNE